MKKLINDPADVVSDALRGVAAAHPELRVDHTNKIIYRGSGPVQGKVGIISGGGSGHEPLHGGFVGVGMLDAACAGAGFTSPVPDQMGAAATGGSAGRLDAAGAGAVSTSPVPDQMPAATKAVSAGAGVVHIVKNYTGDVLNFRMAAELSEDDGIEVATVLRDD